MSPRPGYSTLQEKAQEWGLHEQTIGGYLAEGRIPGAFRGYAEAREGRGYGARWLIPEWVDKEHIGKRGGNYPTPPTERGSPALVHQAVTSKCDRLLLTLLGLTPQVVRQEVLNACNEMSPRRRYILIRRAGLSGLPPATLHELSDELEVSWVRIRRELSAAMEEVKSKLGEGIYRDMLKAINQADNAEGE